MIRIVVQVADAAMAANVGGPVQTWCKTFDVDVPDLEYFLSAADSPYREKHVVGVEVLPLAPNAALTGHRPKE